MLAKKTAEILRSVETTKIAAYTSALTWDEVSWIVLKTLGRADAIETSKKLLRFPNLRFIACDENILTGAHSLIESYSSLRPRDAIHCSSAISRKIRRIVSDDRDFDSVKEIERIPLAEF